MSVELLCRCGHGEYVHAENHAKGWALASYPCGFSDERGCCPCLDFMLKPRKRPPIPSCANGSSCVQPGECGNPDGNDWCSHCGTVLATKEGRSYPSCDSCRTSDKGTIR